MKDLFSKILTVGLSIGILGVIAVVGFIIWDELKKVDTAPKVEEFVSTISETVEDMQIPQVIESELTGAEEAELNSNSQVNYDNVQVDKYFYNQLEEPEKYIYKAFEENKEAMKTGTYTVNFGDFFTKFLTNQNGDTTRLSRYYQSAIEAYTYDNPDVFYLDPNKMYLTVGTKSYSNGNKEYEVYVNSGEQPSYLIDEFSSAEQVNEALTQVNRVRDMLVSKRTGNTYNDIKMVHDYLIDTIEYDQTISKPNIYNMYGALINRVCVCEGYSRAFKYVLESMGIPTIIVIGTGTNTNGETERHAWNYVECDGRWYAVDVTWDDPVVRGGGQVTEEDKVKYFMKGKEEFNKAHSPSNTFTDNGKAFDFPEIQ